MSIISNNKFYTAYTYLSDLYGINISEDIFETMGYVAWKKIGNRQSKMYKVRATPVEDSSYGLYVDLPCNADIVEAVVAEYEDHQRTSSIVDYPNLTSLPTENYIEFLKFGTNDQYTSGKFLKFRQLGDKLYLTEPYSVVMILYKGIYLDEEGLPYLNDKEVHAIATYCAYSETYKKGIQTKDSGTIQLAQLLKQDWNKACSQARVPEYINQNEMNEILNANSSWNRKIYNKSFKVIQ